MHTANISFKEKTFRDEAAILLERFKELSKYNQIIKF